MTSLGQDIGNLIVVFLALLLVVAVLGLAAIGWWLGSSD